jgi:hypothetical protein
MRGGSTLRREITQWSPRRDLCPEPLYLEECGLELVE